MRGLAKILVLSNHPRYTYRMRKEIILELLRKGYDLELICPYGKELDFFEEKGIKLHNLIYDNRSKSVSKEIQMFIKIFNMTKKINPDIILSYTIKLNIYGSMTANLLKIPFLANITGLGDGFSQGKIMEKGLTTMYRFAFKKVEHTFFQNQTNCDFFKNKGILRGTNSVLPGSGVNLEEFSAEPILQHKTKDFLFLSRIMTDKGIREYLTAAKSIKKVHQNVNFHVAGTIENEYKEIIAEYSKKNIIQFHGEVEDVITLIRNSDVVVLPSYHEGMSNTLLEAAAIGRPIITTNVPGCIDTIRDGISGYGIPVGKVEPLVTAIENFLKMDNSEIRKMGLQGRRHIEKNFDRKIVVEEYLNVVQRCLEIKDSCQEVNHEKIS